jgi:hypothetical protein
VIRQLDDRLDRLWIEAPMSNFDFCAVQGMVAVMNFMERRNVSIV